MAQQYDFWARVYDLFWRRYVNQTVPVALKIADVSSGQHVLDLACGTGDLARRLLEDTPGVSVQGLDLSAAMIQRARQKMGTVPGVQFTQADAHDLPFEAASFDRVVCANTFHYFTHPDVVLAEAARVLRPGGRLVVLDWCRDFWTCRVMDAVLRHVDPAYQHCYTLDEMAAFLEDAPFDLRDHFRYRFDLIWGMMVVEAVPEGSA